MSRNFVLAIVGLLCVGTFVGGGVWFLTSWQPATYTSNRLDVHVCNCTPDSLQWEADEFKALLGFYHKDDVSSDVDFLVPFVHIGDDEGYAIPSNGMSWIAQSFAPSTYRKEYREQDEELFWHQHAQTEKSYNAFHLALDEGLPDCDSFSRQFKLTNNIIMGSANAQPLEQAFTSIASWRDESLNPGIESGEITAGDHVLIRLNCVEYKEGGCMDENACNYNPKANVEDGSCIAKDECGKCDENDVTKSGPGKIYECGCVPMPKEDCDCYGNKKDAIGVCGGDCLEADDSGRCIEYSDSDGDGVWDKEDACPTTRAQGDGGNGCKMDVNLNNDLVQFEMTGTVPGQKIKYVIKRKGSVREQGWTESHQVFPRNKSEANRILQKLSEAGGLDIEIQFWNKSSSRSSWEKSFSNLDWICVKNGNCGPFKK